MYQLISSTLTNQIDNHIFLVGRKEEMGRNGPDVGRRFEGQARPKQLTPNYKAEVRPCMHKEGMPRFGALLL